MEKIPVFALLALSRAFRRHGGAVIGGKGRESLTGRFWAFQAHMKRVSEFHFTLLAIRTEVHGVASNDAVV